MGWLSRSECMPCSGPKGGPTLTHHLYELKLFNVPSMSLLSNHVPLWDSVDMQRPLWPQGLSTCLSYRKWQPPSPSLVLPLPFSVMVCSMGHSTVTTMHLAMYLLQLSAPS